MAKILKSFDGFTQSRRSGKHDWETLCDGSIRELKRGEDFSGKAKWFAVQCRLNAKKRGMFVRMSKVTDDSDRLVVQFVKTNGDEQQPEQPTTTTKKK